MTQNHICRLEIPESYLQELILRDCSEEETSTVHKAFLEAAKQAGIDSQNLSLEGFKAQLKALDWSTIHSVVGDEVYCYLPNCKISEYKKSTSNPQNPFTTAQSTENPFSSTAEVHLPLGVYLAIAAIVLVYVTNLHKLTPSQIRTFFMNIVNKVSHGRTRSH